MSSLLRDIARILDKLPQQTPLRRSLITLALILSVEAVFLLPFMVTRVFRAFRQKS